MHFDCEHVRRSGELSAQRGLSGQRQWTPETAEDRALPISAAGLRLWAAPLQLRHIQSDRENRAGTTILEHRGNAHAVHTDTQLLTPSLSCSRSILSHSSMAAWMRVKVAQLLVETWQHIRDTQWLQVITVIHFNSSLSFVLCFRAIFPFTVWKDTSRVSCPAIHYTVHLA